MKKRSEKFPEVFYEPWKTPISGKKNIKLESTLQTITQVHFFFSLEHEKDLKIHVMTIPMYPFRVIDHEFAQTCVGKYFKKKGARKKKSSTKPHQTWKLWNTDLIKELDDGPHALSHYEKERDQTICEYLVMTESEWIEIIDCEPEWEVHHNIKIEKLLEQFVKKRYTEIRR